MSEHEPHVGQTRRQTFMVDDKPDLVTFSMTPETMVLAVDQVGDQQDADGIFWPVGGRAVATIRNQSVDYGGGSGITCDAMLAEYDPATGLVYQLLNLGARNGRVRPWKVGDNVSLLANPAVKSQGVVIRGSELGIKGMKAHVYIAGQSPKMPGQEPIILHHRFVTAAPPTLSTIGFDDNVNSEVKAELSDSLRINSGVDSICPPKTSSNKQKRIWWTTLNGTMSGGKFSGWLATTHADGIALHSNEMAGALRLSTKTHDLGYTHEGKPVRPGAVSCDTLFTRGNPKFDRPLDIEDVDEPPVAEPQGHPERVYCQQDRKAKHRYPCGEREGVQKWHYRSPVVETPPCDGSKNPVTGPELSILPSLYFVGAGLMNGYRFSSHPGA